LITAFALGLQKAILVVVHASRFVSLMLKILPPIPKRLPFLGLISLVFILLILLQFLNMTLSLLILMIWMRQIRENSVVLSLGLCLCVIFLLI
jgi:hypothetical protein